VPQPAWEQRFIRALENAERFFMGKAKVQEAAFALAKLLDDEGIPYAIAGALALGAHGYERVTVDVDVLLTRDGLERFKAAHLGRGYVEKFPGSKGLRDAQHGVVIDVLLAGDYPGDGKPKPVRFPDPSAPEVLEVGSRFRVLRLEKLVELKLASGISAPHRLKDLADVLELIRAAGLPRDLAARIDASVRDKYEELWLAAQTGDA
jgi:hypothetical protein